MKPAVLLQFVGVASMMGGLLLIAVGFRAVAPPTVVACRVAGVFLLVEAAAALWLAGKRRSDERRGVSSPAPAVHIQSFAWVWGPILGLVAVFGGGYWLKTGIERGATADFGLAYSLYQRKDYAGAETKLRIYDEDWNDDYGLGHYYLGLCLEHEGKIDEARDAFREAMHRSRSGQNVDSDAMQTRYHKAQQHLQKLAPR